MVAIVLNILQALCDYNFPNSFEKVKVKVTHLCLTLCDPMDYTVHVILQARMLEWVTYPFSSGSSWPRNRTRSPALQMDCLLTELPVEPQILRGRHYHCFTNKEI